MPVGKIIGSRATIVYLGVRQDTFVTGSDWCKLLVDFGDKQCLIQGSRELGYALVPTSSNLLYLVREVVFDFDRKLLRHDNTLFATAGMNCMPYPVSG
jgi:hypothetical protein